MTRQQPETSPFDPGDDWIDLSYLSDIEAGPPLDTRYISPRTSLVLVPAGPPIANRFSIKGDRVTIMIAFGAVTCWEAVNSDRLRKLSLRNRCHFLPSDTESNVAVEGDRFPEFLLISIDPIFARSTLETLSDHQQREKAPLISEANPTLMALGRTIRSQVLSGRHLSALQLESYTTLCLAEWADDGKTAALPRPFARTLARLEDYIRDHLDQDLSLTDLADVAELSPSHFLRSFKKATGQTPHRYLMERRLQQAQNSLAESDLPIAEIAYACGFASQSHMTDVFKATLNISPARYRRATRC